MLNLKELLTSYPSQGNYLSKIQGFDYASLPKEVAYVL